MTAQTSKIDQADLLSQTPYDAYVYSYPHKTAYRPLDPPVALEEAWSAEDKNALFLYLHVPFCEMRCGFCNLFTTVKPGDDLMARYIEAIGRQARRVKAALGPEARFARVAIGGGTPTFLSETNLAALVEVAGGVMGADMAEVPMSVEMSPETARPEKLKLLRAAGADRASIGVQSFVDAEVGAISRAQRSDQVARALDAIRDAGFPTLNIDLMYGLPEQDVASWLASIEAALRWKPEELYLYPLYVRPLTRMGQTRAEWDDDRLELYRRGRAMLLSRGYRQISMRMFRSEGAPDPFGPVYRCQADGMVGLGCGARSYTQQLHYSSAYAVGPMNVKGIIRDFVARSDAEFERAGYGFALDEEEVRRRHAIVSLLSEDGLDRAFYSRRFDADPVADMPELLQLMSTGLAEDTGATINLTEAGLERSDAVGPWLFTRQVKALMGQYEAK